MRVPLFELESLLAVDLGLRSGLALYGRDGRLNHYRSTNFGASSRLRRGVPAILEAIPNPVYLVMEGGGPLGEVWVREGERRGLEIIRVDAATWRRQLLRPREQQGRDRAKHNAGVMARQVIDWSGAPKPVRLRHDAAEAILVGLWGVLQVGWLKALPQELRR